MISRRADTGLALRYMRASRRAAALVPRLLHFGWNPQPNAFGYFDSSPEVIRPVVMVYVRYPLALRNVEDLLFERGIDIFCLRTCA